MMASMMVFSVMKNEAMEAGMRAEPQTIHRSCCLDSWRLETCVEWLKYLTYSTYSTYSTYLT